VISGDQIMALAVAVGGSRSRSPWTMHGLCIVHRPWAMHSSICMGYE